MADDTDQAPPIRYWLYTEDKISWPEPGGPDYERWYLHKWQPRVRTLNRSEAVELHEESTADALAAVLGFTTPYKWLVESSR